MSRSLLAVVMIILLASASWAIDGAKGVGTGKSKIELQYAGGGVGAAYNVGLTRDWTVYGSVLSAGGVTGFGAGTKYAFLNEAKGDNISFAGKLDLLLGGGTAFPIPGLVISKQLNKTTTVLGEANTWSVGAAGLNISATWLGAGVLYNLDKDFQLAGLIGMQTVNFVGISASGIGFGLGLNITL